MESTPTNATGIVKALWEFGFNVPELNEKLFLTQPKIVRMGIPPMRIELLTQVSGIEFAPCYERRLIVEDAGLELPVISLQDLRANKQAAGRAKDLADLGELPDDNTLP